jgi:enamine deaminase RidA (YjgF/YER057c/UK114 family)
VLAQIVHNGGVTLDAVKRVVKLTAYVNSTPDFAEHHLVANGGSDLIVRALGDKGRHARVAIGVAALPLGAAVEIEALVEAG